MLLKGLVIPLRSSLCTVATLVLLYSGSAAAAPVQYLVGVDTSSVSGTMGFLDFQFNPVNGTAQAAIATISDFNGGGGALGTPQNTGDVSGGPLPVALTFTNDTGLNEVFQPFTFPSAFSFVLSLSGPALSNPDGIATVGSTFGVILYDSSQIPILTNQTDGVVGSVSVLLNGTTATASFPTATGGPPVLTFQVISGSVPVPEPASMSLFTFGAAGLVLLRKILR